MRVRTSSSILVIVCLQLSTALALAQSGRPEPTLYEIGKGSTYQKGCFDPCECPIMEASDLRGTFLLTPLGFDGLFENFSVTGVRWVTLSGPNERVLTGSGAYRVGGEFAVMQQLSLDLQTNGGPSEHFDSGLIAGGGAFPAIQIAISIRGFRCFDTGIHLFAWPAMRVDVGRDWIAWSPVPSANGYDAVMGEIGVLHASGGDFASSTRSCLGDGIQATSLSFTDVPAAGQGFWFLARSVDGTIGTSYDEGDSSQVGSRDAGITASPASCP